MAWTSTDLSNIEDAIRALVAGTRTVSLTMGDKSITYDKADLPTLLKLKDTIASEIALTAGTAFTRSYAGNGGRCS